MQIKKRGVYLLPNILTTFGLFSGFYSIILAINSNFIASSIAIFIAMLWDGLDGRVARLTNTSSEFGEQYDSMADLISFGIAPAFLVYFYTTSLLNINFANFTLGAVFIYIAGASLRLARFNAQINNIDKNYFQGLPSPTAAALIAGSIWLLNRLELNNIIENNFLAIGLLFFLVSAGLLMVSNIRYYSFKSINLKNKSSFRTLLLLIALIILITIYPAIILFSLFFFYTISGIILTFREINRKRQNKKLKKHTN